MNAFVFNMVGVSDGISMGTSGMNWSLPSRELISDSIESVINAQWYDGCISVPGCDKNIPACIMAMGRYNRPSIIMYGGSTNPGKLNNKNIRMINVKMIDFSYTPFMKGRSIKKVKERSK